MRILFLAALALPAAPLLAQPAPTLVEGWAPGGKTPIKHYRVAHPTATCETTFHHVPAGKGASIAGHARDHACKEQALRATGNAAVQAD